MKQQKKARKPAPARKKQKNKNIGSNSKVITLDKHIKNKAWPKAHKTASQDTNNQSALNHVKSTAEDVYLTTAPPCFGDPFFSITSARHFNYTIRQQPALSVPSTAKELCAKYCLIESDTVRELIGDKQTTIGTVPGMTGRLIVATSDVYVRSGLSPTQVLGPATVCTLIDGCGFIYGIGVTVQSTCWTLAGQTLENALVDKVKFCSEFGIKIQKQEWLGNYLPQNIFVDSGAMVKGFSPDSAIGRLGLTLSNRPSGRHDLKHILEQHFAIIDGHCIQWLPGTVPTASRRNGVRNTLDGALTFQEFNTLLVLAVLKYNSSSLTGYRLTADMIAAGVAPCPIDAWNFGLKHGGGLLRLVSLDHARLYLLPTADAVVTAHGIRYGGLHYTCERAVRENWFGRARNQGPVPIKISYDPRRVDHLYLHSPDGSTTEHCLLTPAARPFKGFTWAEVVCWKEQHKSTRPVGSVDGIGGH